MQKPLEACTKMYFIMPRAKIHLLRFILEAYEGIALVTTLDPDLGLIELSIAQGCEDDLAQILSAEMNNLQMRQVLIENSGYWSVFGSVAMMTRGGQSRGSWVGARQGNWSRDVADCPVLKIKY